MPAPAERTQIGLPTTLRTGEHRGVQRIALRPITPLARAHALTFLAGGFLHRIVVIRTRRLPGVRHRRNRRMRLCKNVAALSLSHPPAQRCVSPSMRITLFPLAVLAALACTTVPMAASASSIRVNTVGYLPDAPKVASVDAPAERSFTVVRAGDGQAVLTGRTGAARRNVDTDEDLVAADFSAVREPGEYRLRVEGAGTSPVFRLGADVYREPFRLVTRAMYLWRCGIAVDADWQGRHFHHDACHTDDAWLDHVTGRHEKLPSTGGWHDAGDYNKYVVNAGITLGSMLRAWEDFPAIRTIGLELPESGGPLPDFLAEVKFETDWLFTMQDAAGRVYAKVSTERFGGFIPSEEETAPRYVCPWGSPATADFVAMLAQASRAFRPYAPEYADRCLAAARRSYAFLQANPEDHAPDQSAFHTGGYTTSDPDDRLWAAAELWETTGDAAVLADLETRLRQLGPAFAVNFDWADVKNLALLTYVLSARDGRDPALVAELRRSLREVADEIVATARAHGYARPLGSLYSWGGNGCVARQTLLLHAADRLAPHPAYRETALDAANHLLGRNVDGRSYVTGLGHEPPQRPHDRRSGDRAPAWPGYLVGGPNPGARDWRDEMRDYRTNEIAINWNAALIYAFASLVDAPAATPSR